MIAAGWGGKIRVVPAGLPILSVLLQSKFSPIFSRLGPGIGCGPGKIPAFYQQVIG